MGIQHLAIVSWGFILNHGDVKRVIQVIEEKRKLQGKESIAPETGKRVDWDYLDDIFSVVTSEKFTVLLDLDYDNDETTVSIFYKKGLGTVERWGRDCRCSTIHDSFSLC
jgi:hypothetical protein